MHQVDCTGLLTQDNPDALGLRELLGANERGFREHMTMLEILSKNRDLQAQVEEAEHMLTEIDIESLPSFNIGFERGEEKGREEGREEGEEKGMEKAEARIVHRLLSRLGIAEVSQLLGLAPEAVERMAAAGEDADSARDRH